MGEPALKQLDPILCMSLEAKTQLEKAPWKVEQPSGALKEYVDMR